MRNKLSTVIGFGILTLLLTAGAAQSLAGSNTVFTDDIVDGTIRHADVKANSIGGSRLLDNAVTGTDVNEGTLVLTCPADTTRAGDICFGPERPPLPFRIAMEYCHSVRLHLPTLSVAGYVTGVAGGTDVLWVDNVFQNGSTSLAVRTLGGSAYTYLPISSPSTYRCVTTVGARP